MYQRKANQAYQQVNLESEITNASPYQLIRILFNGALSADESPNDFGKNH